MKEFILEGKMTFEAENLSDAFKKIADHFQAISNGEDSDLLLPYSDIRIHLVDE